jgi:hypothetical protein
MPKLSFVWDLEDDPDGNVAHIAEHGVTPEEVEEVLEAEHGSATTSRSSGNPIVFGWTQTGKYIAVVFEEVDDDPPTVYPITAYETQPPAS